MCDVHPNNASYVYVVPTGTPLSTSPSNYIERIDANNWARVIYYAPMVKRIVGNVCANWKTINTGTLNFEKIESGQAGSTNAALYFLWQSEFRGDVIFGCSNVQNRTSSNENLIEWFGQININKLTYKCQVFPNTIRYFGYTIKALRLEAPQIYTSINWNDGSLSGSTTVDLEINKNSVGVNVANRTWAGKTFKSITLI